MNEVNRRLERPPPPREIKAKVGGSGRTSKTSDTSDMSVDCDSVVSEVTLDAAFDKIVGNDRLRRHSDPSFYKNVVVKSTPDKRQGEVFPQESVGKLDGSDFLNGKFKSAFHKELSTQLTQTNSDVKNEALLKVLLQKKKALEQANIQRQQSNARLDDMPRNSLLDMFTTSKLSGDVPEEAKEQPRRRRSSASGRSREKTSSKQSKESVEGFKGYVPPPLSDDEDDETPPAEQQQTYTGYVPPPRIEEFGVITSEQPHSTNESRRASEITVNPSDLIETQETDETAEKDQDDQPIKRERRSSKHGRKKPSTKAANQERRPASRGRAAQRPARGPRAIPTDIPTSITIAEDDLELQISALDHIQFPEDNVDTKGNEERRHSQQENNQQHLQAGRQSRKEHRDAKGTSHRRSPSEARKRRDKTSKHKKKEKRSLHSSNSEESDREPCHPRKDSFEKKTDCVRSEQSEQEPIPEEHSKPTLKPHPLRRSSSAPDLQSFSTLNNINVDVVKHDDDKDVDADSPKADEIIIATPNSASSTPMRKLWRRISDRSISQRMNRRHPNDVQQLTPRMSRRDSSSSDRSLRSPWSRRSGDSNERSGTSFSSGSERSLGSRGWRSPDSSRGSILSSSRSSSERSVGRRKGPSHPSPPGKASGLQNLQSKGFVKSNKGSSGVLPVTQSMAASKPKKNYTPTVVHGSEIAMSYSELVMHGKIGISAGTRTVLKPTPEGSTLDF